MKTVEPALVFHEINVSNPDPAGPATIKEIEDHDVWVFIEGPLRPEGIGSREVFLAVRLSRPGRYFCVTDEWDSKAIFGQILAERQDKDWAALAPDDCEACLYADAKSNTSQDTRCKEAPGNTGASVLSANEAFSS